MQCLQYVLYSLRSLQNHSICVKGHQNNLQTSKIIPRRDSVPDFLIPGSATEPYLFCCRHIRSLDEVHKTKNNIYVHSGSMKIYSRLHSRRRVVPFIIRCYERFEILIRTLNSIIVYRTPYMNIPIYIIYVREITRFFS